MLNSNDKSCRYVRDAEMKDITGIISVLEQNLIVNKIIQEPDVLEKTGFLISRFSEDDAKSAIIDEENFIFLVPTENNEVIGYAIGCNVKKLQITFLEELSSVSTEISNIISTVKILYLRHIAKTINKIGVGKELLQHLLYQAKNAGYKFIICVIAERPIQNKASKSFHEKCGFVCVGFYQDIDRYLS